MNSIKRILCAIGFFLLSVASILTIVDLCCFDRGFYEKEYAKDQTAERIGMSEEDLMASTNTLLDYLQDDRDDIVIEVEVNGDKREVFDERETAHMVDVKALYQGAVSVRNVSLIAGVVLLCVAMVLLKEEKVKVLKDGFLFGIGLTITLIAAIAFYAVLDFTAFWTNFHELFFNNDLWLLNPQTDVLIRIMPQQLFEQAAIRLLFDLFDSGFARDVALEAVNRLLLQHEQDMYATLDALYLNLRSGQAEFIKCGAPPTFVYRAERLHTVSAEALPAGIVDEARPAVQRARIRRDDTIIMFSDGALDALGERTQETIGRVLADAPDCQAAAERLLHAAQAAGAEDDMTVMVIRIA